MNDTLQGPAEKPGFNWSTLVWVLLAWMAAAYLFQTFFAAPEPRTIAYVGMEKRAKEILESHLDQLDALADALLERETLTRGELRQILHDASPEN